MGDLSRRFSRHEFACRCGCGFDTVDHELIIVLERMGDHFEDLHNGKRVKIHINSGARCPAWNKAQGGADTSQHLFGRAADHWVEVVTDDGDRKIPDDVVADYYESTYPDRYGLGRYVGRTHIDTRSSQFPARWDLR